jgi:ATP-dependent Clp protease ATP-binding subunit ClpA
MSPQPFQERLGRLNRLSEALFGAAADVERAEAEELLKAAGLDLEQLKRALYRRLRERSEKHVAAHQPLPPLLRQALEDLAPIADQRGEETPLARTARLAVARLIKEIRALPTLLNGRLTLEFSAAYRNKKELSARDKKLLDSVADELRKRIEGHKTK